jgi:sugar fermentation stimulation protein A
MPDYHTDFDFSRTMLEMRKDLQIVPVAVRWNEDLTVDKSVSLLEVPWKYLEREIKDRGSYLLLIELGSRKAIEVGSLNKISFAGGYYVYVGSAMNGLSARLSRHGRKDKKPRWHIDYLTRVADVIQPIPIRSSQRLECQIAEEISSFLEPGPGGFGSSDCGCPTHLWWSAENPLNNEAFHRVLQGFRMNGP